MTYEEKKAWLGRYREARRIERLKLDEYKELRSAAEHITQVLSPAPGGSGDGQALPRAVERIENARLEALNQAVLCAIVRAEVLQVISEVEDATDYEILTRRYIHGEKWEQIADKMNLDRRWITRRHRTAVESLTLESP